MTRIGPQTHHNPAPPSAAAKRAMDTLEARTEESSKRFREQGLPTTINASKKIESYNKDYPEPSKAVQNVAEEILNQLNP